MSKNLNAQSPQSEEEELFLSLLEELKTYARAAMRKQSAEHSLQPTALVNEFYLKLRAAEQVRFNDSNHFLRCAATMMRQILVDHARRKNALKRTPVNNQFHLYWSDSNVDMLALDDALEHLLLEDPKAVKIVELRYLLGASISETANALNVSTRTVERKWTFAKAFLREKLQ